MSHIVADLPTICVQETPKNVLIGFGHDTIAVGSRILTNERAKPLEGSSSPVRGEIEDAAYEMFPDLIPVERAAKAPGRMTILEAQVCICSAYDELELVLYMCIPARHKYIYIPSLYRSFSLQRVTCTSVRVLPPHPHLSTPHP